MGIIVDSSIFIAVERGKLDLRLAIGERENEAIAIAAVTASELLHGVHRAVEPSIRQRREAFVERLLSELPVVSFDLVVARVHARLAAELATKGSAVGAHDLQIAATAIAMGYDVATRDERSFPRVPGLSTLRW